jgi:hypothetical protein|tara:strand:+ start:359 stop:703 length:345 start_codon:yes stop_codon:yes gene_type:complete
MGNKQLRIKTMNKTLSNNRLALDSTIHIVYNSSMTSNNNKGNDMINKAHDVRVIKHIDGSYNTFANFPTVQEAVAYMRNWNANAMDSWYIIDANGNRLRMNQQNKLEVFHSLIG